MKKVLSGFLATAAMLSTLVGCSSGNSSSDNTAEGKTKLTGIILKHGLTKPNSEMEWLQEVEGRVGVEIEWQEVSADWDQQKGTLLASGDIPDIIIGTGSITDSDFSQFPGLFEDFSDYMDQLPNVQKMFEEQPETEEIATQLDGSIMGLSKYQRFWPQTATRQYINQEWLDDLGLEVPTNWDELFDVLVAFKEEDANGNGDPNDETPMDFGGGFGFFTPVALLGSLGITVTDANGQGYFVEDGEVKNYFVEERYKTAIQFLHRCFDAGLINSEVFTQDYTKYQSLARGDGDVAKVGYTFGWMSTDRFGDTLAPQYTSMAPLKVSADSTETLAWTYDYNTLNYSSNVVTMSANSKNKDAALAFINELYDPTVSMQVLFGSIGPNIQDNGDGTYKLLPPADEDMDQGTWKWTSSWADNGPMFISDDLELTLGPDMEMALEETEPLTDVLNSIDKEKDVLPTMFMKFNNDDNNTLALNNTSMMSLAEAKYAQWIENGGIEKEWDDYVKELERAGLSENIEIMQRYYDEYESNR